MLAPRIRPSSRPSTLLIVASAVVLGMLDSGHTRRVRATTLYTVSSSPGICSSGGISRTQLSSPSGVSGCEMYGPMPIMSRSMSRNRSMSSATLAKVWPGMPTMMPLPAS